MDSLLQLCAACRHTQQVDLYVDFLERIIYKFQSTWHHLFNPFKHDNTRVPYSHEKNRSFYFAILQYIFQVGKRGCARTAMEYCKLLFNLDHTDPMAVLYIFDYQCMRCQEYKFLYSLYHKYDLQLYPNFAYSVALAKFYLENNNVRLNDILIIGGQYETKSR